MTDAENRTDIILERLQDFFFFRGCVIFLKRKKEKEKKENPGQILGNPREKPGITQSKPLENLEKPRETRRNPGKTLEKPQGNPKGGRGGWGGWSAKERPGSDHVT